eukprot:1264839-Alexandrium_andersonii.AAC.1
MRSCLLQQWPAPEGLQAHAWRSTRRLGHSRSHASALPSSPIDENLKGDLLGLQVVEGKPGHRVVALLHNDLDAPQAEAAGRQHQVPLALLVVDQERPGVGKQAQPSLVA